MQCSHSATLLETPQDHLSGTALAWQGRQKPAGWGFVALCYPTHHCGNNLMTRNLRSCAAECGCSLTTITPWWCYLTSRHSPLWWTEQVNKLEKSEALLLLQSLQHMDVTAVNHTGVKKCNKKRETESSQSCSDSDVSCVKATAWRSVVECYKLTGCCEERTGCLGNISGEMRPWWLVDYEEEKVTYILLGPTGYRNGQYHPVTEQAR